MWGCGRRRDKERGGTLKKNQKENITMISGTNRVSLTKLTIK